MKHISWICKEVQDVDQQSDVRRVDIPRGGWHEQENGKKKAQVKLKHGGLCI